MARGSFGGGATEYVENSAGARQAGVVVTMWTAETAGTQVTDLMVGATAATTVTSGALGRLPVFAGPDEVIELWADAGGGSRTRLEAYGGPMNAVQVRRYVAAAWEPRGSTSTKLTVFWLKPLATDPDPPINATFFLQGTDVLLKASA